jgi:hypothetical protein
LDGHYFDEARTMSDGVHFMKQMQEREEREQCDAFLRAFLAPIVTEAE